MSDSELIKEICNIFSNTYSIKNDPKYIKYIDTSFDVCVPYIIFNTLLEKKIEYSEKNVIDFLKKLSKNFITTIGNYDNICITSENILSKNDDTIIITYKFFDWFRPAFMDGYWNKFYLVIHKNPNKTKSSRNIVQ